MGKRYRDKRKKGGGGGKGKGKGGGGGADDDEGGEGGSDVEVQKPPEKRRREDVWHMESGNWELKNEMFEGYYTKQGICPRESWEEFLQALRTPLPVSIRINRMRAGADAFREWLQKMQAFCEGQPEKQSYSPERLPWYPNGLVWQWRKLERRAIKKDPALHQLKEYLIERDQRGLLTRQEIVSMVPPLFLQVEPHHLVLDMCAAPGSKTTQMVEMMHSSQVGQSCLPTGLVLANDLQWKRANMLAHQVARLGSPCMAVVNLDAVFFPDLSVAGSSAKESAASSTPREPFLFDRVLCDVPCSGDGTMRKTPFIWKAWTFKDAFSLHIRQLNILYRGLDVLRVGGRLVYSTCSFNPLEDEAVVAAALRRHGSSLRLVAPPEMDELRAAKGLERWVVPNPREEGQVFESYADPPHELKVGKMKLLPSMFAPGKLAGRPGAAVDEESERCIREQLQHCRRFLPHLMDTGGFFVTIFEKVSEFKPSCKARREARKEQRQAQSTTEEGAAKAATSTSATAPDVEMEEELDEDEDDVEADAQQEAPEEQEDQSDKAAPVAASPVAGTADAAATQPPRDSGGKRGSGKGNFTFKPITKEYLVAKDAVDDWHEVVQFYGLEDIAPSRWRLRRDNPRRVFLLSEGVDRLMHTETRLPTRMVLCGVLAFESAGACHVDACPWRLAQEGAIAVAGVGIKRRCIKARRQFLLKLMSEECLSFAELKEAEIAGELLGAASVKDAEGAFKPGSVVVALHEPDYNGPPFAVVASISDDALELASVGKEAAGLKEDLEGQPPLEKILVASADPAVAADAASGKEVAGGDLGTASVAADADPDPE